MELGIREEMQRMKKDSARMMAASEKMRNQALADIKEGLIANQKAILEANEKDLQKAREDGLDAPLLKRLKFDEGKILSVIKGIEDLINLPDPLHQVLFKRELDEGLVLVRETCPIGVIGVIFESRPDALVQISTLCLKSGNCAILKGGREALYTNRALFDVIYQAGVKAGLPEHFLFLAEARSEITQLLSCHEWVDLLIPRGSNAFVQYIMDNTKIPVMGHADGICHIYADQDLDVDQAIQVIVDSKTQYPAVCNATETLLVHKNVAQKLLPPLMEALQSKNVEVRGTEEVRKIVDCKPATEEDFATEYLDYIISIALVESMDQAIDHINHYGSHHTDCILTTNDANGDYFMEYVDSAGVYRNCSTRFADGYRYGFGAEVGIGTGKLHARGPVGLDGLCTYKYKMYGKGHIVADYAEGRKEFHFQDIKE